jgi:hypothetical protein
MSIGSDEVLLAKHYILTNDIVFDPNNNPKHIFDRALIAFDLSDSDNFQGVPFTGSFEGNHFTIQNLYINSNNDFIGLFGCIENSKLSNIHLLNCHVVSNNAYNEFCGSLVGRSTTSLIRNCSIEGLIQTNGTDYVGGLIGHAIYDTLIEDCHADLQIDARKYSYYIGGLIGCTSSCQVKSCSYVGKMAIGQKSNSIGGLIGRNYNTNILHSSSTVLIEVAKAANKYEYVEYLGGLVGHSTLVSCVIGCNSNVEINIPSSVVVTGGLIGYGDEITVSNSFSGGDIWFSKGSESGGFIGYVEDVAISNCYSTVSVISDGRCAWIGGFIGSVSGYSSHASIQNCFSTGNVNVGEKSFSVGGFFGNASDSINVNCYSLGYVVAGSDSTGVGALSGAANERGIYSNCYYLIGIGPDNGFGLGLTPDEMQNPSSFENWDFAGTSSDGLSEIWCYSLNSEYPLLNIFENPPFNSLNGSGTVNDPFEIYTVEDLALIQYHGIHLNYCLMNDLDMTGITWHNSPIALFCGKFDGRWHSIKNLEIQGLNTLGFFGGLSENAKIMQLGLEGIRIFGAGSYIGGFVAVNYKGIVRDCSVKGRIHSGEKSSKIAGFSGENRGSISQSFSRVDIYAGTEADTIGGFIGFNCRGQMSNCYSVSNLYCSEKCVNVGGMVGNQYNSSGVNCFAAGSINGDNLLNNGGFAGRVWGGHLVDDYYFLNTLGPVKLGSPLNDEQMKNQTSYHNWDFFFETDNGTEDIWFVREGVHYPKLWWEHHQPIAYPGGGQMVYAWIDSYALVQLDGTGSYDPDGDMLEYFWFNDTNELIATGADPNVVLGVGEHVIDLIVNDGIEDSEPDSCVVTVIEAIETAALLTPQVLNRDSGRPHVIGRLAFAGEAMPVLDPNEPMVLLAGHGQIEDQRQMLDYSKKEDVWYLMGFFDNLAVMEAIDEDGLVEVTIAAKLISGQWVYGADVVKVK